MGSYKQAKARRLAGFSLIEVMFSMTVLVIGLLGSEALIASYASIRRLNEETQAATIAARQQVDLIRALPFADIVSASNGTNPDFEFDFQVNVSSLNESDGDEADDLAPLTDDADGNVGKVELSQEGPVGLESSLILVTVTIEWRGIGGNRRYQISTYISQRS